MLWRIPKLLVTAYEKMLVFAGNQYYCNTILLFKMKYVIDGGCLFDY